METLTRDCTELRSLNDSIKIWKYLAESGDHAKANYPDIQWLGQFYNCCPLCARAIQQSKVNHPQEGVSMLHCAESCPLAKGKRNCECEISHNHPYFKWLHATTRGQKAVCAEEFLDLLTKLRDQLVERLKRQEPREEWVDITTKCQVKMVKSGSSDGYYGAVMYKGRRIVALGLGRFCYLQGINSTFKLVKAKNATVSFRVMMRSEYHYEWS